MSDEPKRARRIRDKIRMKARARRVFKNNSRSLDIRYRDIYLDRCEHLADNLQHCSKPCCNKPRFWEGPPMQERREALRVSDQ